jgi:hypothetical protein
MTTKKAETTKKETVKKSTTAKKEVKTEKNVAPKAKKVVTDEDIAVRAYEIHVETGNENEMENWMQAEKELRGKKK